MSPGGHDDTLPAAAPPGVDRTRHGGDDAATLAPDAAPDRGAPIDDDAPTLAPDMSPGTSTASPHGAGQLPRVERDSYVIAGQFAQGGIGRILRAHDPTLDRPVALKELLVHGRPVDEDRFVREVLLTARLQHPGVVPVYAAGRWPSGEPFFAMKLVSGRSFDKVIAEATTLAARLALLPHVLAIAETVAYAHSRGIIHRDLKPHNVLVGAFGETVVIDWGLAKELGRVEAPTSAEPATGAGGKDLTFVGAVVGTPGYMSPEQADGADVDTGTDVYALGVILYQVLSGRLPYDAESPMEMVYKTAYEAPVPLRSREPDAPDELVAIVDKAMARDRARRYPSAREFAEDLRRFQTGQIVGAHRYSAWERVRRFVRRHRAVLGLAAISVVVIVAVTALSFVEIREQRDLAEHARDLAEHAERRAQLAQTEAERRADNLSFEQARLVQDRDPLEAMRLLHGVSEAADWRRTRQLAADLVERGLPRALRGHRAAISRATFSPDGRLLATTSDDCTLRLWDMSTWTSRTLFGHTGEVWRSAWSPDQRRVATTSRDRSVRVWDVETGEAQVLLGHTDSVRNVAFSPDGRALYSADDALALRRWDLATGEGEVIDRCHGNSIPWTQSHIACIDLDRGEAHVYDLVTGERRILRADPGVRVQQSGGIAPDGRWFAASTASGAVWLADTRTGAGRELTWPVGALDLQGSLREIRFSPASDQFVAPAWAKYLRHYDLVRGRATLLTPHEGYTRRASFSPDGTRIASVGGDSRVAVWDLPTSTAYPLAAPAHMIDAQFSPDGRWVAGVGNDPRVFVWPTSAFTREQWTPPEAVPPPVVNFLGSVPRVIMSGETGPHLVDTALLREVPLPPLGRFRRLVLAGPGRHAVGVTEDDELVALALADGAERTPLAPRCDASTVAAVDPERPRLVLTCDEQRAVLVDLTAREPVIELARVDRFAVALFVPGADDVLLATPDGRLLRFDGAGRPAGEVLRGRHRIAALTAIPDTRELVFAAEDLVQHVAHDGRRLGEFRGHQLQVSQVVVSGDGRWILTISRDNRLRVFDRVDHSLRIELAPPDLLERHIAISHDGSRVAVSVTGGDVLVWDIGDGPDPLAPRRDFRRLRGLTGGVRLAIEADGRSVLGVGVDGRIIRWRDTLPTDPVDLRAFIAAHADAAEVPKAEVGCAPPE